MASHSSALTEALTKTLDYAIRYRNAEDTAPVAAMADHAALLERLNAPLADRGQSAGRVIDELIEAVEGGLHNVTGPRFFGWVNGGSMPAALAADWLTSTWDQNASLFTVAPAACTVEEVVGAWLKDLLRLPEEASFALVTGCQMAHFTCLAAARHRLLRQSDWDVEQNGLSGAPTIRVLTSTEVHGSALRAVRLLGLGERNLTTLAVDWQGKLSATSLRAALELNPTAPTIVLLQAGDLNIGAFDDFDALIPMAKEFGAWVHVDGAFGLWLRTSARYAEMVRGLEAADSWATDGHKWLNVPYDCGYAFVRDAEAQRAAFSHTATYVTAGKGERDPLDWNPEWSRRARGFSTYAALRELGRSGVSAMIERCCDHAHAIVMKIGALEGATVMAEPQINQGLLRFLDPSPGATEADHDRFTDIVTAAVAASGEALLSNTTWRGLRSMRVSVCNWQTSAEDVERVVRSVADVLARLRATGTTGAQV